jgi:hypothetical protein
MAELPFCNPNYNRKPGNAKTFLAMFVATRRHAMVNL